jgi:hypothetical protein
MVGGGFLSAGETVASEGLRSGENECDKIMKVKAIELAEMATTVCKKSCDIILYLKTNWVLK